MGWFRSLLVSPLKKLWDRLHSPRRNRKRSISFRFLDNQSIGKGIYILYKDVKSCPCEDVQMLWSILVESTSPNPPSLL